MKIRQGFVSNSSSSSFCIAKVYMLPQQIRAFEELLDKIKDAQNNISDDNDEYYEEETTVGETDLYFVGQVDNSSRIHKFIKDNNLTKVSATYC